MAHQCITSEEAGAGRGELASWPGAKTYDNFLQLSLLLEEVLGRRVELLTRESLSPYIGPRILNEAEHVALGA